MTSYNGEKHIHEQLSSILDQLNLDDEVIISDDGSKDDTIKIIESFRDDRIKLYKDNNFRSPIFNLENGLKKAQGEYIFLADQDDVWYENKVDAMIQKIRDEGLVMSDAKIVDENLNVLSNSLDDWRVFRNGFIANLWKSRYLGCCMAFHRDMLKVFLPFPKKIEAHDIWLGLLSELNGGVEYIPKPYIKYRRHENNYSTVGSKSKKTFGFMLSYRLYFLIKVILRTAKIKLSGKNLHTTYN